ncbi:MAG: NifX-associated nitrogen fixation protein [Magnetospirillum sp.]|nr:NifX-associated nitrogen fixation protein [Magnetospirillum sp.]
MTNVATEREAPPATPFLKSLIGLIRAEDSYGAWDRKTDVQLLDGFIVTKEDRRAIPIIGDPDPDVLGRVELFYRAVALAAEKQTGLPASPMMTMSHEGFGRVILAVGKLVAYSKTLRDVHRFGFEDTGVLEREGMTVVGQIAAAIDTYPDVARA